MRDAGTARRAGRRSKSLPKRCGWEGYCERTYSVRATWAFSCRLSTWAGSERPQASGRGTGKENSCDLCHVKKRGHTQLIRQWCPNLFDWRFLTRATSSCCKGWWVFSKDSAGPWAGFCNFLGSHSSWFRNHCC